MADGCLKKCKIGHKFLTGEWLVGTYKKCCDKGKHKGEHGVSFRANRKRPEAWYMESNLDEYGPNGTWAIVKSKQVAK